MYKKHPEICPTCGSTPKSEDEQPQSGSHGYTMVYECGLGLTKVIGQPDAHESSPCGGYEPTEFEKYQASVVGRWKPSAEVFETIARLLEDCKWRWSRNTRCKYVDVRIDMRDGKCVLTDRHGKDLTIDELKEQL